MRKVVGAAAVLGVLVVLGCGGEGSTEDAGVIQPPPGARMHFGFAPGGGVHIGQGGGTAHPLDGGTTETDGGTDGGMDGGTDGGM